MLRKTVVSEILLLFEGERCKNSCIGNRIKAGCIILLFQVDSTGGLDQNVRSSLHVNG